MIKIHKLNLSPCGSAVPALCAGALILVFGSTLGLDNSLALGVVSVGSLYSALRAIGSTILTVVPRPGALVEKNGSNARSSVEPVIPCPVSSTVSRTYEPGGTGTGRDRTLS